MIKNYIKTTLRHIGKSKVNFGFRLGGLTFAIFSLLIILLYVRYQQSFDRFHDDHANIYRVNSNRDENGAIIPYSMVPPAIGPALKDAFPEIESFARLGVANRVIIQYNDKLFRLAGFIEADSSVFDILSFTFVEGDSRALQKPGSVVLTRSIAKQIFGNEDPMHKTITSPDHSDRPLTVSAIIEDYPSNSHLVINALHSFGSLQKGQLDSWEISWDGSLNLFVKLAPGTRVQELAVRSLPLLRKNLAKNEEGSEKRFSIYFQPIADIFLDAPLKMEFHKKGNALYVYIFSMLGIFLLMIAGINYVNLCIADFDTRTREIGVRKILGARKTHITFQVTVEAILISIVALGLSLAMLYFAFPLISSRLEPNLRFEMLKQRDVILAILVMFVSLVAFSVIYPSYRLIKQQPLKDIQASNIRSLSTGKILLLAQYGISILCICSTVIIGRQLSFILEKDLGYDRSRVISFIMPDEYPGEKVSVLKNEFARLAGVEAVSYSYYLMPVSTYFQGWYQVERNGVMEKVLLNEMFVDHDYFETMGINIVNGRKFDIANPSDMKNAFIINETAAKELGWENPLGKRMMVGYNDDTGEPWEGTVIGVARDFNTVSLHRKIEPVVMRLQYDSWPGNSLNVKVKGNVADLLPLLVARYEEIMPGFLADARVLEDLYRRQYRAEDNAYATLQLGTVVIVLISVAGIFSMSLYMSIKRMKEFGIRKVLGATISEIAALHLNYFLKIALLANIISLPVAYWLMKEWLDDFAYRAPLSMIVFAGVMVFSMLLVILSGWYSAWKSGRVNPIDVIKTE
jgi:putative ABC transport system permease protein